VNVERKPNLLKVLFYLALAFVFIAATFQKLQSIKATKTSAFGCNYIQLIPPEEQPQNNLCPADKPVLEVKVWADFKGNAVDSSMCQNPGGDPVPCGTCPLGYGDRLLGPGLTSECVVGPNS